MRNYKFERLRRKSRAKGRQHGLSDEQRAALEDEWGLGPGVLLKAYGHAYAYGRIGGMQGDGRPWVWGYRVKKNGTTYTEPTRLERWEVCTLS